ncbi:glutathione S-transferase domain protein [Myxococcus xanthus DK 1622]|uniref:Glutathione S-transferase domain protein n=2 Tax=Myxococcus xanthus TaxID=34 RepID=Q1D159_MYXXD|nr:MULTISPECIES: glutathione S-transferase family protein [Myxococcus]ABF88489.1 glutathione S-transferase domain protein [Myxococcus xanthus DK 1622]NOJ55494.1 glutathione S-transferase family protein [Myxococcus xanthus]QPM77914.1 glutathione S-transferase family protein [Myxococcus xanthus]QZZ53116.1 Glutathione S-transferase GST-6.0 [Myxococcus xanthus]UYI12805.1 glutathione S-transferase family protein [Myxococcus xanthus]
MNDYELIGSPGCGSAIVEMALSITGIPHRLTELPYLEPGPGRDRLLKLNPLGQVPTLILPDGAVMTESAAIILHLHDVSPQSGLVPEPTAPERVRFLNLLFRLVGAVYPTFTYADDPPKWTLPGPAADRLRDTVMERRANLWREIEAQVGKPHVLGKRFSALDLYVTVMTHWRPNKAWFIQNCPALAAAASQAEKNPHVAAVLERHFS